MRKFKTVKCKLPDRDSGTPKHMKLQVRVDKDSGVFIACLPPHIIPRKHKYGEATSYDWSGSQHADACRALRATNLKHLEAGLKLLSEEQVNAETEVTHVIAVNLRLQATDHQVQRLLDDVRYNRYHTEDRIILDFTSYEKRTAGDKTDFFQQRREDDGTLVKTNEYSTRIYSTSLVPYTNELWQTLVLVRRGMHALMLRLHEAMGDSEALQHLPSRVNALPLLTETTTTDQ